MLLHLSWRPLTQGTSVRLCVWSTGLTMAWLSWLDVQKAAALPGRLQSPTRSLLPTSLLRHQWLHKQWRTLPYGKVLKHRISSFYLGLFFLLAFESWHLFNVHSTLIAWRFLGRCVSIVTEDSAKHRFYIKAVRRFYSVCLADAKFLAKPPSNRTTPNTGLTLTLFLSLLKWSTKRNFKIS